MPPPPDRQPVDQMVQSTAQWGGRTPKAGGRTLDGRTWDQYPARWAADAAADNGHRDNGR
jgi:hypothetical protein